eukprot:TCALIF_09405-PA protein Name:"Similar to ADK Adenosine kinase (Physcomitrella patens subsp. patens)" AED:0.10 eAED:0.12 QI:0/0/0/0.66/1/1/3/0/365
MSRQLTLFFGNALLDLTVPVTAEEEKHLVQRFGLVPHVGQEKDTIQNELMAFVSETRSDSTSYAPGGCALNSSRMMAWLCQREALDVTTVFIGTRGAMDRSTQKLLSLVQNDGVDILMAERLNLPTGHCINLVQSVERTMVANLGAASHFNLSDLQELGVESKLKMTQLVYMEGFFAIHSLDAFKAIIHLCCQRARIKFCFNLCGEYVCRSFEFVKEVTYALSEMDILYGNMSEFETFLKTASTLDNPNIEALKCGLKGGQYIQSAEERSDRTKGRLESSHICTVIITNGSNPVISFLLDTTASRVFEFLSVRVPKVPRNEIKDTVGAGDCFVAGYLFAMLLNRSRLQCIEKGVGLASFPGKNWY